MTAVTSQAAIEGFLETRLRRWTPAEFRRMVNSGVFASNTPVELVNGQVYEYGLPRLWTRDEYYRLGDKEVFRPDERTELLDGRIIRKVTMNPPHTSAVRRVLKALQISFGDGFVISGQSALNLSTRNDPEPDAMVSVGALGDYDLRHPTPAETLLVVEVSDSTLREDRHYKAGLYARADIAEYWIVNINARTLEVRRQPLDGEYMSVDVYAETESVAPLAAPNSPVSVADLLPFARPDHSAEA
jgi:Uma2 family endonuclease